ncbi:MAG: hypothetical protein MK089_09855 [Phycisphaerales bacterium]|nr:hypothetical protein [Phycisphaerales bacterium]
MNDAPHSDSTGREQVDVTCDTRCPWCGTPAKGVWVHGHLQCKACGGVREPCCSGERPGS